MGAGGAERVEGEGKVKMEWDGRGTLLMGAILITDGAGRLRNLSLAHPDADVTTPVLALEVPTVSGGWELVNCDLIIAQARKGVSVGASSALSLQRCHIRGWGKGTGEVTLELVARGLARCALQAFDAGSITLNDCSVSACRQAVCLFDDSRAHATRSRFHLPPGYHELFFKFIFFYLLKL